MYVCVCECKVCAFRPLEYIHPGAPITNRQRILTLSSLVEGLNLKDTGSKLSITSDDSLFAPPPGGLVRKRPTDQI